ncbi:hypothetical protein BASA82_000804 [Batrachochytrium salamandrivorans]|uniref:Uncharacterized protein n=1 Tax=Batrachochytrium salamandrivorans TaxID=1357716 RepID=A0ABQ8FDH6_9FUNG|nr:hypothetical protein BASA62_006878 [Batrachochytrium salamandrivorans]KAH6570617.1 hypothetical protein BASA60_007635 [Batrachochytrium salamandrivorans]KAH6589664.1 hypothetical protein BASA61_005544 [Batrachochytrium salamandrivorans]KAH6594819.1 hypothetical protein BASA50_006293 [Batrachochytrium salamandrivorans]KAH9257407.1 hypothetical protein BASA81_004332 [Batrachochytrium salamandrivorans]
MKFNALVVAAMVITSVNAAGKGKFGGYFGDKDESKPVVSQDPSMSEPKPKFSQRLLGSWKKPKPSQGPPENVPNSASPQEFLEHGSEPGSSQDSPMSEPNPELLQDPQVHEQVSELSQDPPAHKPKPKFPQKLLGSWKKPKPSHGQPENVPKSGPSHKFFGHGLKLVVPSELSGHISGKPQYPDPEASLLCDFIDVELSLLWENVNELNLKFKELDLDFYRMTMEWDEGEDEEYKKGKRGKRSKKHKKSKKAKKDSLKVKMMEEWLKLNDEFIPKLRETKTEYDGYKANLYGIWERLDETKCPVGHFEELHSEEMTRNEYFPKWKDTKGKNILGEY